MSIQLLGSSGAGGNTTGDWFKRENMGGNPISIHIRGTFSATVNLEVTNDPSQSGGTSVLTATSADMYDLSGKYEHYRAVVSGYSSGTVYADIAV